MKIIPYDAFTQLPAPTESAKQNTAVRYQALLVGNKALLLSRLFRVPKHRHANANASPEEHTLPLLEMAGASSEKGYSRGV